MENRLGKDYRQRIGGLQAEEIYARAIGVSLPNIGSQVQLRKAAGAGNPGYSAQLDPVHPKRDDPHPGGLVEGIYL